MPRRASPWRIPLWFTGLGVIVLAACWAPFAPIALAPIDPLAAAPVAPTAMVRPPVAVTKPVAPKVVTSAATPLPLPTGQPTPEPIMPAAPSASGLALLASIESDHNSHWVKNHAETPLRSGSSDDAQAFTMLPQWTTLKQIDSKPDWLMVQYAGDGDTRAPGPGWVKASDVGAVDAPDIWLASSRAGTVWSAADSTGKHLLDVPSSTLIEVLGPEIVDGSRVHVRLPGDGRQVPPTQGWMDADALARTGAPDYTLVPRAFPADLQADVRINVPYRTQLDGSAYASANCGPTALGMALEAFGMNLPPPDLRRAVLRTEVFDENDDDAGSFIWALADVASTKGLKPHGLYEDDGSTLHRWTTDEIRNAVRSGEPVIVQVVYRALPGREASDYYGDHYVVVTGLIGDNFLYNDPIGGPTAREAPGYDRVMTAAQLQRAMRASDSGYAYTAFALSRT